MLGVFFVLGGTSFLFILIHDALVQSTYFEAKHIVVEGNRKLSKQEIIEQGSLALGDNILNINLKILHHRLIANPWIAAADVKRDLPDTIRIRIRENVPVAIVELDRPFLLNESGQVFKTLDASENIGVPVVTGLRPADIDPNGFRHSRAIEAVQEVLQLTKHHKSVLPTVMIERVHVDHEMGLTLQGGGGCLAIRLGFGEYGAKFNRLKEMVDYLRSGDQLLRVGLMDLHDMDRVIVRPAQRGSLLKVCYRKEM